MTGQRAARPREEAAAAAGPPSPPARMRPWRRWRIDRTRPVPPARTGIDNDYYEGIDELWWDPGGPAALLHALNPARVGFFLDALGDLRGARVLDAGCGGGLVAAPLVAAGATVVGVDQSAASLGVARRRAGARFWPVAGHMERLPLASGSVDAVVAADVLEHVPDLPAAVAEVARVLRPGGSFVFDTINRTAWAWVTALWGAERLLGLVPRGTHDWKLLIRPAELERLLSGRGLRRVVTAGLAPRLRAGAVARALARRRLDPPAFAVGRDQRASWLGHYRKVPS